MKASARYGSWYGLLAVVGTGCSRCTADLPDPPIEESAREDTAGETGSETGQVDEPPCDVPESEPNGTEDEAGSLPLDRVGCGVFGAQLDQDLWRIAFPQEGWVAFYVEARAIGSKADPDLTLQSAQGQFALVDGFGEDPTLVFPTQPDEFTVMLADHLSGSPGGPDYHYEILATWAKEPVSWNRQEDDAGNDLFESAEVLGSGDRVLAWVDSTLDTDWFMLDIPGGKHTVTLSVEAYAHGSAGNFKIVTFDEDKNRLQTWYFGEMGFELDPWARWTSSGDERIYLRVIEESGRYGRPAWYLLAASLESSP
jgi:hypothetical protein